MCKLSNGTKKPSGGLGLGVRSRRAILARLARLRAVPMCGNSLPTYPRILPHILAPSPPGGEGERAGETRFALTLPALRSGLPCMLPEEQVVYSRARQAVISQVAGVRARWHKCAIQYLICLNLSRSGQSYETAPRF